MADAEKQLLPTEYMTMVASRFKKRCKIVLPDFQDYGHAGLRIDKERLLYELIAQCGVDESNYVWGVESELGLPAFDSKDIGSLDKLVSDPPVWRMAVKYFFRSENPDCEVESSDRRVIYRAEGIEGMVGLPIETAVDEVLRKGKKYGLRVVR